MAIQQQGGMFGPTPEELRWQMMQEQMGGDQAAAQRFGQGNLGNQISYAAYMGGAGIGRGLMGLGQATGVIPQDPRLAEAQRMMEIKKRIMEQNIDPEDIDNFYPTMIKELASAGLIPQATALQKEYAQVKNQRDQINDRKLTRQTEADAKLNTTIREREQLQARVALVKKLRPDLGDEEALGIASTPAAMSELLKPPTKGKSKIVKANGRVLLIDEDGNTLKDLGEAGKSVAEAIAEGLGVMAGVLGKKTAESTGTNAGKEVGEQVATIQKTEDSLTNIAEAKKLLQKGIYAGGWGNVKEATAKYSGGAIGDRQRVINTEKFRAYIGEVVIPRLKEFGGNDTEEERAYLEKVQGGNTVLEPEAIKAILDSAEKKIRDKVKRLQKQYKAVQDGKPLPTDVKGSKPVKTGVTKSGVKYEVIDDGED